MKTIAVVQRKGGNGKTTSCLNIARALSLKGKRVLMVDLDDQKNTSSAVNVTEEAEYTVCDILVREEADIRKALGKTAWENVEIVSGSGTLSGAVRELENEVGNHLVLKEKLLPAETLFDFCLIDTSPSLNILTVNALCAADYAFIPLSSKYFSLVGLEKTVESIHKIQKRLKPELKILGTAFVIYDGRASLSREVVTKVREEYTEIFLEPKVNQNIHIEEAQVMKMSVFDYKKNDRGAVQYMKLCEELLSRTEA
ncbi:MAG: ParA family protein [Treponema sp.]|nr:ParA family protein [Treponema sp.]